jgi:hypothetical protein
MTKDVLKLPKEEGQRIESQITLNHDNEDVDGDDAKYIYNDDTKSEEEPVNGGRKCIICVPLLTDI